MGPTLLSRTVRDNSVGPTLWFMIWARNAVQNPVPRHGRVSVMT